jgi:23S rRNA-/tRNA-specific pseudouridylate synthase
VKNGQEIIIELPEEKEVNTNGPVGTDIPLNIIYEDDHLAILNKRV